MKSVLIVENMNKPLIRESNSTDGLISLNGVFTEFGIKNRNDRIYTAEKFLPCLQEMNERISTMGVVYGEFDHPDVFDTSLSRASHLISKAEYVKEGNRVDGEIKLLSTYWGKEARSLVNDGCPIFVSSRAAGVTESDGTVTLKKLFTYDIVADPGFASAKMNIKVLNESLGYETEKSNFRIYDVSDESKINELFNMNTKDLVTKKQLTDYSKYLVNELASTKKEVRNAISKGNMSPKKFEKLMEYYDNLNNTNGKIVKYLDYLAEKIQVVVNENTSLKTTTDKLIKHNDYLAENLEKAINYGEYLAENLDKNIAYSEYIAENLDKNISYSEYIAENLDKTIEYSEYIAENLDKTIEYSEYIAENLDKNISYSEYLAENLDNSIEYSEYLAEHVEGNIAYSEYIAENLDDNIAYSEYVAESLDKSISYQGLIVEKLNGGKLLESSEEGSLPSPSEVGFEVYDDNNDIEIEKEEEIIPQLEESVEDISDDSDVSGSEEEVEEEVSDVEVPEVSHEVEEPAYESTGDSDTDLSKSIDKLIEEAKKRKVTETSDRHFLKFLNKSQVDSFYSLNEDEQETVTLYISERSYFNTKDVLKLITEALSAKNETLEERVIRLIPESVKPIWNQLNESSRKSILSQARLYPEESLMNESQIDHFWNTRNLKKNESITKKLVSHESLIQEDKVSDAELKAIMERFKNL
jgi:hypothetical protein